MRQRRGIREPDAERVRHRVDAQLHFRRLQRPGQVMNVSATQLATAVHCVKTVSVGVPPVERPRSGAIDLAGGFIRSVKLRVSAFFIDSAAKILKGFPLQLYIIQVS